MQHVPTVRRIAAVLLLSAAVPAASADDANRVALLRADAEAYGVLDVSAAVRTEPDADLRLVVVRDGEVVGDHGLARIERPDTLRDADGRLIRRDRSLEDRAWLTRDAGAAVVLRSNVTLDRPLNVRGDTGPDRVRVERARVALTWFDPAHPAGRWTRTFPSGSWLAVVRLIDPGTGVAVLIDDGERATFQVLDRGGHVIAHRDGLLGSRPTLRASADGSSVAADLALRRDGDGPDRLLFVVHLAGGKAWSYPWRYVSDREPLGWAFDDDGAVRIDTPLATYRYAPDGTPLNSTARR
jgi:hypothetical protein